MKYPILVLLAFAAGAILGAAAHSRPERDGAATTGPATVSRAPLPAPAIGAKPEPGEIAAAKPPAKVSETAPENDRSLYQQIHSIVDAVGNPTGENPGVRIINLQAALWRNEEYAEAARLANEREVDEAAAPLFAKLGLSESVETNLRQLLTAMMTENHRISETGGAAATGSARDEMYRTQIHELLGDPAFSELETYFEALPQRLELRSAFRRLAAVSTPLTVEQKDALISLRRSESWGSTEAAAAAGLSPLQVAALTQWIADSAAERKIDRLIGREPPAWNRVIYPPVKH